MKEEEEIENEDICRIGKEIITKKLNLVENIERLPSNKFAYDLAENLSEDLYEYEKLPIKVPPKINENKQITDFGKFLEFPNGQDELLELSIDSNGNKKRLDRAQLKSIQEFGEFSVQSKCFPDQFHRWKLARLLQRGRASSTKGLRWALSWALRLIIVYAKNRLFGKTFSVAKALRARTKGAIMFVDLLFGFPAKDVVPYEEKIIEKKSKFLVEDLCLASENQTQILTTFFGEYEKLHEKVQNKRVDQYEKLAKIGLPYSFYSAVQGLELIDLSLEDPEILKKVENIVNRVIAEESNNFHNWALPYRDKLIEELHADLSLPANFEDKVSQQIFDKYLENIIQRLKANHDLKQNVTKILIEHSEGRNLLQRLLKDMMDDLDSKREKFITELQEKHPIKFKVGKWRSRAVSSYMDPLIKRTNETTVFEKALEALKTRNFHQTYYFLERIGFFISNIEPNLRAGFQKILQPTRIFKWRQPIWFPQNYIVLQFDERDGSLPPVRVKSIVADYADSAHSYHHHGGSHKFTLNKTLDRYSSTHYLGWRWLNLVNRYWCWTWKVMFYLIVAVPWASPVSIRALYNPVSFYASYTLDRTNGVVCFKSSSKTGSMVSRIRALWRHVRNARTNFEETPDRGFLGKSVSRPLNKFWNIFLKGFFGTVILILAHPVVCTLIPLICLLIGLLAPFWMLLVVLLHHLFIILIFDKDNARRERTKQYFPLFNMVLYRFLTLCILQPIVCILLAFVILPLGSVLITLIGYLLFGIRSSWDWIMMHLLIKRFARVPAVNSFVARRVAGPGLSTEYFYQMRPETGIVFLKSQIELNELEKFQEQMTGKIKDPLNCLREKIKIIGEILMVQVDERHPIYQRLQKWEFAKLQTMRNICHARKNELWWWIDRSDIRLNSHKVRMTGVDLGRFMAIAVLLLKKYYPTRVLSRVDGYVEDPSTFWKNLGLVTEDWKGLAEQIIANIFSDEILVPLEEGEKRFELKIDHINFSSYMNQLFGSDHREDLDAAVPYQKPAKHASKLALPVIDANYFTKSCILSRNPLTNCSATLPTIELPAIPFIYAGIYGDKIDINNQLIKNTLNIMKRHIKCTANED